jgi:hypothetical protein
MVTREVTVQAADGKAMTAGEIAAACVQVPIDVVPTFRFNWSGTVRAITFKVSMVPDGD